ncbi:hypothetical protein RJ640_027308 [Escallonia rubra]|uniref:Phytocyanin domain-containing protein n=1 Tax=Escallonia rubra TaxID=112253 RepID=A0AA88UJB7_9ASTE|nr:hypothetical protein RJ640_027308 [Escallonia rubra]
MAYNMLGFFIILAVLSPAMYPVGAHNVFKVNGTGFESCIKPTLTEALMSGNDAIVLATPGRKWYICGVKWPHCAVGGQKLFITVSSEWMAPSPLASSANGMTAKFFPAAMILVLIVSIFGP